MIQSMTGYGKATAELSDKKINVEIKSLNSKAMDLSTRIAPLYREKEIEIRNEIAKALERGKVDFSLWIDKKDACELITPINQDVVVAYYERIPCTRRLVLYFAPHAGRDDQERYSGTERGRMESCSCHCASSYPKSG